MILVILSNKDVILAQKEIEYCQSCHRDIREYITMNRAGGIASHVVFIGDDGAIKKRWDNILNVEVNHWDIIEVKGLRL